MKRSGSGKGKTQICSLKKPRVPTARYLRAVLCYDPGTGIWRWRDRADVGQRWNARYAGKVAGCPDRRHGGRMQIRINKRNYFARRLAFLYMTGRWLRAEVDNRDGDPSNESWSNLREATSSQIKQKKRVQSNSRSGLKGVSWRPGKKKWRAVIEGTHLGYFDGAAAASAAYRAAALERFGEFARAA